MLNNDEFLDVVKKSFIAYLQVNTSRSTAKLKVLHGSIAKDLQERFGKEFTVLSQGFYADKEGRIDGRYYPKKIDISITKDGKPVAGYGVKFVMRNYRQNGNNYFENMLGETANIRSANVPYFQIFIIFDTLPYYKEDGTLITYENVTMDHLHKYVVLSNDNPDEYFHTPDKTLLVVLALPPIPHAHCVSNSSDYASQYRAIAGSKNTQLLQYSQKIEDNFNTSVILNDYANFRERSYNITVGKLK